MTKKPTNYLIQVDGTYWSIQADELVYDVDLATSSGGAQHNLPDENSFELQLRCEAVIASMLNLHKYIEDHKGN